MLFKKTDQRAIAPQAAKPGDAGADLHALEDTRIPPRGRALVRTGIAVAIPFMHVGRVLSRSGLSLKNGIEAGAGVIDAGYRGEIGVVLHNHTDEAFHVAAGDRIAQLVVTPIAVPAWHEVEELEPLLGTDGTHRGEGGFGSTGIKVVADPSMPPDRAELRDAEGKTVGVIENIATDPHDHALDALSLLKYRKPFTMSAEPPRDRGRFGCDGKYRTTDALPPGHPQKGSVYPS